MLAFRPLPTAGLPQEEDSIRLYFNLFDLNQSGRIDHNELKLCLENLLPEEILRGRSISNPEDPHPFGFTDSHSPERNSIGLATSIFEMFLAVDTSKDGYIDFEEFKQFYQTIMKSTSSAITPSPSPAHATSVSSGTTGGALALARSLSLSPPPLRATSPLPKTPPRSASAAPPRLHSSPPPERDRTQSANGASPLPSSPSPSPASSARVSPALSPPPSVRKGTGAGVAARIQGLDPSKIIMPGMMPPKRPSPAAPIIKQSTSLPPDAVSGSINVDPLLSRGVLKTNKPRRRMTAMRRSPSADMNDTILPLPSLDTP
jgi:hypothetical protein